MFQHIRKLKKNILFGEIILSSVLLYIACNHQDAVSNPAMPISNTRLVAVEDASNIKSSAGALKILQDGFKRYLDGQFRHIHIKRINNNDTQEHFDPAIAILTCTDLAIPADILFDTDKKDLLILKTGADTATAAALDEIKAAADRNTKLVVVLGHKDCASLQNLHRAGITINDSVAMDHLNEIANTIRTASSGNDTSIAKKNPRVVCAFYNESSKQLVFKDTF